MTWDRSRSPSFHRPRTATSRARIGPAVSRGTASCPDTWTASSGPWTVACAVITPARGQGDANRRDSAAKSASPSIERSSSAAANGRRISPVARMRRSCHRPAAARMDSRSWWIQPAPSTSAIVSRTSGVCSERALRRRSKSIPRRSGSRRQVGALAHSTTSPRDVIPIDHADRSILNGPMRTVTGPSANVSGKSRDGGAASRPGPMRRTCQILEQDGGQDELAPPETADSDVEFSAAEAKDRLRSLSRSGLHAEVLDGRAAQPEGERDALDPDGPAQELPSRALSRRSRESVGAYARTASDEATARPARTRPATAKRTSHQRRRERAMFFLRGIRHE